MNPKEKGEKKKKAEKKSSANPFAEDPQFKELAKKLKKEEEKKPSSENEREKAFRLAQEKAEKEKRKLSEDEIFLRSVGTVKSVEGDEDKIVRWRKSDYSPGNRLLEEEAEVLRKLSQLVDGTIEFDISPSDEYVEIRATDLDITTFGKLMRGEFARQAWLNLHGMNRDEAREAVEKFLFSAVVRGWRCVGLIPGRGLHSESGKAILKPRLISWLKRGRFGRIVLGVCSALPNDGGLGAIYVLLRKKP